MSRFFQVETAQWQHCENETYLKNLTSWVIPSVLTPSIHSDWQYTGDQSYGYHHHWCRRCSWQICHRNNLKEQLKWFHTLVSSKELLAWTSNILLLIWLKHSQFFLQSKCPIESLRLLIFSIQKHPILICHRPSEIIWNISCHRYGSWPFFLKRK